MTDTYTQFVNNLVKSMRFLKDDLPLVVSNTDTPNIHDTLVNTLKNQYLDSIYFSCPYISDYFVSVLRQTTVKSVFVLIDKDPTDYVKQAVEGFFLFGRQKGIEVNIVKRPDTIIRNGKEVKTPFLHQKILVPLYKHPQYGAYPPCAYAGSVNFTANGVKRNDEALIVLRNSAAIIKCLYIIFERSLESKNIFSDL